MRVLGVGVAVVLLSLIFLGTATGESKPISENDLSQAIAFRTQFGLDADPSFAQTVASNPEASSALGIPLLPEEIADLDARDAAVAAIGPLIGLLEADPTYAGIYVDQSKGGPIRSVDDRLGQSCRGRDSVRPAEGCDCSDC
jgi:hypothetical protein